MKSIRMTPLFFRRVHKWVGLVIGIQFILWSVSGAMMAMFHLMGSNWQMVQHMEQQQQRARERLLEQKLAGQNERQAIGEAKMMQRKRDAAMLREQRSLIEDHVRRENIEHVQRARELNAVRRA